MTNPTSNFGWQMPTSTDLVTDLPADFEVFGQAVDTSLADLKGGTSGQILAKATNADMDFTWITNDVGDITAVTAGTGISGGGTSGAITITNSMATEIDAKGDLIAGTGADAFSRLAVGTNNQVLTADSTTATGLKWAAPAASATILTVRKSADQSVTNNDSPVDDTHLKFAIGANETFIFHLWIYPTAANSTPNMNYLVVGPAGSTTIWSPPDVYTAAGGTANATVPAANVALSHYVDSFGRPAVIFGSIANGSTAGDVQFKWSQNTSSATSTTVKAGSYIYGIKVS